MRRSRSAARKSGDTKYKTGRPCLHGHDAPRLVSSSKCTECVNGRSSSWYEINRQKTLDNQVKYRLKTVEKRRNWSRKYMGLPEPSRPEPNVCELCSRKNKSGNALSLDHDHGTGS